MIIQPSSRLRHVHEYYFSQKLGQIRQMELAGKKIINLGIGNPDMSPSEATLKELIRSAGNQKNHGYQSYRGVPELRKAISAFYHTEYNTELDSETEILPLLGSKEGITHISFAFLDQGDKVLVPDPGYPTYSSVTNMSLGQAVYYNLSEQNQWQPDMKELSALCKKHKPKLMWLNYPNMPSGAEATGKCFEDLVSLAVKNKILLCHDNPYSMVLNQRKPKSILSIDGAKEVAIELNSLSKSFNMAGWRVGWVAGKKEYIDTILKIKSNVDSGMFLPVQHASVAALKNPQHWHNSRNRTYQKRRKKAWQLLDLLKCSYVHDQAGMFVWAKIPQSKKKIKSAAFAEELLQKAGVYITPGFVFGKNGEGYIRVSLCSDEKVFNEAILRIKRMNNTQ